MSLLSIIIPSYNEEKMVLEVSNTIRGILDAQSIKFEIIFVDDGSIDTTWQQIELVSTECSSVRGIRFSRNFGKEAAIIAGLTEAKGDCCVVIDCDLQHPPEKIVEMYHLWEEGYEVIEGYKINRGKEGVIHKFFAKMFYKIICSVTGFDMANSSDFKLLDRKAVNVLINLREKNAFFRALSSWMGFKSTMVNFEVKNRTAGESKWSTISLIKYAIRNITSFSTFPMQIVTFLGIIMMVISVVLGVVSIWQKITGVALGGFTTIIILQLFSSSIIMLSVGIIGYYISRIFEEVKNRPLYIISKKAGRESKNEKDN